MEQCDGGLVSLMPEAKIAGPASSRVSESHEWHDVDMQKPCKSLNIIRGALKGDSPDAKPKLTEGRLNEVTECQAVRKLERFHDPQERGIITALYETSKQNFETLLMLAKASSSTQASNTTSLTIAARNQVNLGSSGSSNQEKLAQYESLQRDFIRLNIWGEQFDAAGGRLDEMLECSERLKEDLIVVLLHLSDALQQGLPYLKTSPEAIEGTWQLGTVPLLEIAQFYIEENVYLGINVSSFADIVDEISIATEGLGDLSFCLEEPAVDLFTVPKAPRAPSGVTAARSHRAYEEMIRHRFPRADAAAISHHATANYFRFLALQKLRREAEKEALAPEAECDEEEHSPDDPINEQEQPAARTIFHDSGIGTSHRHESSYAKSLMSFTKRTEEQYTKFLPKLPEEGALGRQFQCSICLRKVQVRNEEGWTGHVIEDLLPYVCVFHDCSKSTEPFQNRSLWLNHLMNLHGKNIHATEMACSLCKEVVNSGHMRQITHLESHLLEIALSVMPRDGDPDQEAKLAETNPHECSPTFPYSKVPNSMMPTDGEPDQEAPAQSSSTPASGAKRLFSKFEITKKALLINETKDANPDATYSDFRAKDQSEVINAALPEEILEMLLMAQIERN